MLHHTSDLQVIEVMESTEPKGDHNNMAKRLPYTALNRLVCALKQTQLHVKHLLQRKCSHRCHACPTCNASTMLIIKLLPCTHFSIAGAMTHQQQGTNTSSQVEHMHRQPKVPGTPHPQFKLSSPAVAATSDGANTALRQLLHVQHACPA